MQIKVGELKRNIAAVLRKQGFSVKKSGSFALKSTEREMLRQAQLMAKDERLSEHEDLIVNNLGLIKSHLINGKDLDVNKIDPELLLVESGTEYELMFRWWNLAWWSLPYERAYGRQMRLIIWDKYHNAPIGLVGLQSPILSWRVRDEFLGIPPKERDYWVNQSLSAQRLGALPPYNNILGGKLVAMLMTSDYTRKMFKKKYGNSETLMKKRVIPANLLFITTTGAYGKSSIYNRLKFKNEIVAEYIGKSVGSGSFHIPNYIYQDLILYLEQRGVETKRGFGSGPSRKLRLIDQALHKLGFSSGAQHGIERAVYLFPLVDNLQDIIQKNKRPIWKQRTIEELTDSWKTRWACPRLNSSIYKTFEAEKFIKLTMQNLRNAMK